MQMLGSKIGNCRFDGYPGDEEPEVVTQCDICGEDIIEGEEYHIFPEDIYCEACADNIPRADLYEMLGVITKTARGDEKHAYL